MFIETAYVHRGRATSQDNLQDIKDNEQNILCISEQYNVLYIKTTPSTKAGIVFSEQYNVLYIKTPSTKAGIVFSEQYNVLYIKTRPSTKAG